MAQHQSPAFFTVVLLLLVAAAPLALAQILTPGPPSALSFIRIDGILCCSPTGICIGGPGIGGVNFTVSCRTGNLGSGAGSLILARGTTNATGGFTLNITLANVLSTVGGTVADLPNLPCQVNVAVPISEAVCPALSNVTGFLVAFLSFVGTTINGLGLVFNFMVAFTPPSPI